MIRAGWATVYVQTNAEYGKDGKERYLLAEAAAKYVSLFSFPLPHNPFLCSSYILTFNREARRGMWEKGVDGETPAEYKKRHAGATAKV
jgi:endonuclease YncB( thermonuclease family)